VGAGLPGLILPSGGMSFAAATDWRTIAIYEYTP